MFVRESVNHGRKYLSVAQKFKNENGESRTRIIAGLGYLDDLEEIYPDPKKFFKSLLEKILEANNKTTEQDDSIPLKKPGYFKNLGTIYIKWILKISKLDIFFKNLQKNYLVGFDLFSVLSFLIYSQIIHPGSIEKTFLEASVFIDPFDFELYDVYRALDYFADNVEPIQQFIFEQLGISLDSTVNLYFDGTNMYFESDKSDPDLFDEKGELIAHGFRSKGFSKENRPNPLVNLGLMNVFNGLPIAFKVFPGKEHEKTNLPSLIKRLVEDYHLRKYRLIADRGNYSGKVIASILRADSTSTTQNEDGQYIIGLPARIGSKNLKAWLTDPIGTRYFLVEKKHNQLGYFQYKYRRLEKFYSFEGENGEKEKLSVEEAQLGYYSPKYARREKYKRNKKIDQAEEIIAKPSLYDAKTKTGALSYVNESQYLEKTGERATLRKLSIDEEKIKKQEALDGLYVIVTNDKSLLPLRIEYLYHQLSITEEDFKILKSFLKIRPIYLRKPKHILAHILICIISLQVVRILETILPSHPDPKKIIESLADFNCYRVKENQYFIPYTNEIIEEAKNITGIGFENRRVSLKELQKTQRIPKISDVSLSDFL